MTTDPDPSHPGRRAASQPLVRPFPRPGPKVHLAYHELYLSENGTLDERRRVGNPELLARPWDPATCTDVELRLQLWEWLEAVATWLNHEYVWDPADMIPTCWPRHPHLVRELAVLADQRRRAGFDTTSNSLEEWHRYALPAFTDRTRDRLRSYCEGGHQPWPGRSRHNQHTSPADTGHRDDLYARDIDAAARQQHDPADHAAATPRLYVVDLETGQVKGAEDPEQPPWD